MAYNFLAADREQQFLMPPSVRDWLPPDHLAWFVLDAVAEFDLAGFYARYRPDGRGGAAYEPATMVGLLTYAYCTGERSSRGIERRCREDVGYRVVVANASPDHATIARFRADHEEPLGGLFAQVLSLCARVGIVRMGVVAIDGTKMGADASQSANMTEQHLHAAIEAEVRRILAEAKAIDEAEDALYGDARGDELPPELADRSSRLRRLREAKAELDEAIARGAAADAERAARAAEREQKGHKAPGRKPKAGPKQRRLLINTTDPHSRIQRTPTGFLQGYNAQAAVTAEQVLVAAELTPDNNDVHQLPALLDAMAANLRQADVAEDVGVVLADAGYWSTDNAAIPSPALLIATAKAAKLPKVAPEPRKDDTAGSDGREDELIARRRGALEAMIAGRLSAKEAAAAMGLSLAHAYFLARAYRTNGRGALIRENRLGNRRPPPQQTRNARHAMDTRLASEEGRALYPKRRRIEAVFGQIKGARGLRRFTRRGLSACSSEWKLIGATHNLLKIWRLRNAIGALA